MRESKTPTESSIPKKELGIASCPRGSGLHSPFPFVCYLSMRAFSLSLVAIIVALPSLHAQLPVGSIDPPLGAHVFLQSRGEGVQIDTCTATSSGLKWTLKAPDAKLLDASGKVIGTHFAGPTWRLSDGSQVQGELVASEPSTDSGSVPWLLLRAKAGTAIASFGSITVVRRTDTRGGVAPASGCESQSDLDKTVRVPYTATYTFYTNTNQ
jgi:hypothetical protein